MWNKNIFDTKLRITVLIIIKIKKIKMVKSHSSTDPFNCDFIVRALCLLYCWLHTLIVSSNYCVAITRYVNHKIVLGLNIYVNMAKITIKFRKLLSIEVSAGHSWFISLCTGATLHSKHVFFELKFSWICKAFESFYGKNQAEKTAKFVELI